MITFGWASLGVAVAAAIGGLIGEWWYWRPKPTWRDALDEYLADLPAREMAAAVTHKVRNTQRYLDQTFSSAPLRYALRSDGIAERRMPYNHMGYRVEPIGGSRWRVIENPGTNQGRTFLSQSEANEHIRMRLAPAAQTPNGEKG